jgi:outer membrane protein TolC
MLANNKTLRNQYINEVLLERETDIRRSARYPKISLRSGIDALTARTKIEGADADVANSQDLYANLSLSVSLFDGGTKKRAVQVARIDEEIARVGTEDMIRSLTNELNRLYDLYNVRRTLLDVAVENIDAARLNLSISGDKFKAGTINSFNYRDVQLLYLNASLGRLEAIYDIIDARTALMRITGGILSER